MPLFLQTSLTDLSHKELLSRVDTTVYSEALRELLIRSVNTTFLSPCKPNAAIEICQNHLKRNSQHNFFNLILGIHSANPADKRKYLEAAVNSPGPCAKEINGAAAYELACLYQYEGKYVEAQAWIVKSILCGYSQAQAEFLGNRAEDRTGKFAVFDSSAPRNFKHPVSPKRNWKHSCTALSISTFLTVILSDSNFSFKDFTESQWYAHWHRNDKKDILDAHMLERNSALARIYNAESIGDKTPVCVILHSILVDDPVICHDFFNYCINARIIPEEVYHTVIRYFLNLMPEWDEDKKAKTRFQDMGYYSYAKYLLTKQDKQKSIEEIEAGFLCIERISADFGGYNVDDFAGRKKEDNDQVLYRIFKLLLAKKKYGEAQVFLAKIDKEKAQTASVYDMDIFHFFNFVDMDEKDLDIYRLKQKIFRQVTSTEHLQFAPEFFQRVLEQSAKLSDDSDQLRREFFQVVALMKTALKWVRNAKGKRSNEFEAAIPVLEKSPELLSGKHPTVKEWQVLKDKFIRSVNDFYNIGYQTQEYFKECQTLLDKISKHLMALESSHKTALDNIRVTIPPRPPVKIDLPPQPSITSLYSSIVPASEQEYENQLQAAIKASMLENESQRAAVASAAASQLSLIPMRPPASAPDFRFFAATYQTPFQQPYQTPYPQPSQFTSVAVPYQQPIQMPSTVMQPPVQQYYLPVQPGDNPPPYHQVVPAAVQPQPVQYYSVQPSAPPLQYFLAQPSVPPVQDPVQSDQPPLIDLSDIAPASSVPSQQPQELAKKQAEDHYRQLLQFLTSTEKNIAAPVPPSVMPADVRASMSPVTLYGAGSVVSAAPQVNPGATAGPKPPVSKLSRN